MNHLNARALAAVIGLSIVLPMQDAGAVLREDTGLEATGVVDLDGRLRRPPTGMDPLSSQTETEIVLPFTRSVVSVLDAQAGLFDYSAQADIGTQALRVFGQITNSTASAYIGDGLPILHVSAQIRDVLTFTTALPGPQVISLDMDLDGTLGYDPGTGLPPIVNAQVFFNEVGSRVNNDSRAYSAIGAIGDTLSVPIEITGPTVDLEIDAFLAFTVFQVLPGDTITGALNNTASLRLTLSPGVELTGSKSGTFGEVITPIPVPAALPMFAAAVAAMAALRRRRQSSNPA